MFRMRREPQINTGVVALALGAALGTAAAVYLGVRQVRARRAREREALPESLAEMEEAAVEALREDSIAGSRPIDVAALGPGILELTGAVQNLEEAHRAVDIAQRVDGVHTVINRLTLGDVEQHLAETRDRLRAGDPALQEQQWLGMGLGMGRRRQSDATDPERTDERNQSITRELEPDAIEDFPEDVDRVGPAGPGEEEANRSSA